MDISNERQNAIISKVEKIQSKIYTGPKSEVRIYRDRIAVACPYCGDSENEYKKRGNLYWKTLQYHCYNGGCSKKHTTLVNFLKDFDEPIKNIQDLDFYLDYIQSHRVAVESKDYLQLGVFENLKKYSISREDYKSKLKLIEPNKNMKSMAYLKSRFMHGRIRNFLFDPNKNELHILNLTPTDLIIGLQTRKIVGYSKNKYISYTIEKLNNIVLDKSIDMEDEDITKMNTISLYFGIMSVDFTKPVTVFEGPMDAFLLSNSIALCGIDKPTEMFDEIPTVRYLFDNDAIGRKSMEAKLKRRKQVFMWNKLVRDFKVREKVKDFNELVKYCWHNKNESIKNINDYFTNEPIDIRLI
jgi:hypothetical protein